MGLRVLRAAETNNGNSASVIHDARSCPANAPNVCIQVIAATRLANAGCSCRFVSDLAAFRIDAENWHIPRVWRDFFDSLALEGNADKPGSKPVPAVAEKSECPIEVTAAHADTVPPFVECNERSDHDIEFTYVDRLSGNRLPETEVIHRESRFRERFAK